MPFYTYRCKKHGDFDLLQGMNDKHETLCPTCSKKTERLYFPSFLKCGNAPMGTNREELFNNLAQDGFANKEWKQHDSYYRRAVGIPESE